MAITMQQYFQDNRTYIGACTAGSTAPLPVVAGGDFTYSCPTLTDADYSVIATGNSGTRLAGFVYTIDQNGNRATTAAPAGWLDQHLVLDHHPQRELQLKKHARGFTLIEVATTLSLASALMALAAPSLTNAASVSKSRTVVNKMTQDYLWARGRASMGRATAVRFVLNADCSWTTTIDGVADAAHSFDATQIATAARGTSCRGQTGSALPLTFAFDTQGMVLPSAQFTFVAGNGQTWPLRVLGSGTILHTPGAS